MRLFFILILLLSIPTYVYGQGCDSNTQFLLHMEGADASTTFTDENCDESGAHAVTAGGTAQIDDAEQKWGSTSGLFDGNSDYLRMNDSSDWDIVASSADDWTVDLWLKYTSAPSGSVVVFTHCADSGYNNVTFKFSGGNGFFFVANNGSNIILTSPTAGDINDTNWHHVALIKVAALYGIYVDGTQYAYTNDSSTMTLAGKLFLFTACEEGSPSSTQYHPGWTDEFRWHESNWFSATPNATPDDTITVPTGAYSTGAAETRGRMILMSKFIKIKDCSEWELPDYSCGYERIL